MRAVGIEATTELCRDLMAGGVDSFHFYTLNRSSATREIYAQPRLRVAARRRDDPDRSAPAARRLRAAVGRARRARPGRRADRGAPRELGDTFVVESGGVTYLFTFGEAGPAFVLRGRRTRREQGHRRLPHARAQAARRAVRRAPHVRARPVRRRRGAGLSRQPRLGDRRGDRRARRRGIVRRVRVSRAASAISSASRAGSVAKRRSTTLIAEFEILDGAEAFVHPERSRARRRTTNAPRSGASSTSSRRCWPGADREPSFLDDIAARWDDVDDPAPGIAGDVVLLHIATMTNLVRGAGVDARGGAAAPDAPPARTVRVRGGPARAAFDHVARGAAPVRVRRRRRTSTTSSAACSWRRCCR